MFLKYRETHSCAEAFCAFKYSKMHDLSVEVPSKDILNDNFFIKVQNTKLFGDTS